MSKRNFSELWKKTLVGMERLGGFRLYMLALFLIMFLAYDAQVGRLGFYYDDWEGIFLYKLNFSFRQIWEYFLTDRPMSALVHYIFSPLVGASPVKWHLLGLLLNWAAILFFVKALLEIWPNHVLPIGWMGLLLGIYPGITRQFVIVTSIPHYSSMFLFMLSLWLMVLAFKNKQHRPWLMLASILLGCLQTLLIEYFSGLELIRFFLLLYLARQQGGTFFESLKRAFLIWLPYLIIFITFVVFKFFVLPTLQLAGTEPKHTLKFLDILAVAPLATLLSYGNMVLQDVVQVIIFAWTLAITPNQIDLASRVFQASWGLGLLAGLLAFIVMKAWAQKDPPEQARQPFAIYLLFIMALAIFLGGLPGWITGRQAVGGLWSSRFLFGQVIGAVPLVVVGLVWLAGPTRRNLQHVLLSILLVSSFSLQFRTAAEYVQFWKYDNNFYWQLKWRIPALSPQAFIVTPTAATQLTVAYQMGFAVNVIYASGFGQIQVPYWLFNGPEELRSVQNNEPNSERQVGKTFRTIAFGSTMKKAVPVISDLSRGCLLVADPVYKDVPSLSTSEKLIFSTSHPEMILKNETSPMPVDVFGNEPAHTWCYHFLKADLARQYQEWDHVLDLWTQASLLELHPSSGPEYLPFIEAFANKDNWPKALQLTKNANEQTGDSQPFLCGNWKRFLLETPPSPQREAAWAEVKGLLACNG